MKNLNKAKPSATGIVALVLASVSLGAVVVLFFWRLIEKHMK